MTKKTLTELMLENDVQWPEGAEYVAQDKAGNKLFAYTDKPERELCLCFWQGRATGLIATLPELCLNWHKTVVTREQYEAARVRRNAAKRISDDVKPRALDTIIANIKECDEKIAHHSAELATYTEGRAKFVDELNEILAKVGLTVADNNPPLVAVIKTTGEELHTEHLEYDFAKPNQCPDYCDENGMVTGHW